MNEIESKYWKALKGIAYGGEIESLFQNDFITYCLVDTYKHVDKGITCLCTHLDISVNENEKINHKLFVLVWPQKKIGKYVLDFAIDIHGIIGIPPLEFAIEIDGHDFHEKTKEQARHDKERERFLISAGFIVIRYTGSEVYNAPKDCARDTISTIMDFISNTWDMENV